MIYLAAPYNHKLQLVRDLRARACDIVAGWLMSGTGEVVFSPISHSHGINRHVDRKGDTAFWLKQDLWYLERATSMRLLMLPGVMASVGVAEELEFCVAKDIPVVNMEPEHTLVNHDEFQEIVRVLRAVREI